MMSTTVWNSLGLAARETVLTNQRLLVLNKGRIVGLFGPGAHRLPTGAKVELERHNITDPLFVSDYERVLMQQRPDLAAEHLTVVQAEPGEVVLAFRDGALAEASLNPEHRAVLWSDAGPWQIMRVSLTETRMAPKSVHTALATKTGSLVASVIDIPHGSVGLLSISAAYKGVLQSGRHFFWDTGEPIVVNEVDMRWQSRDVTGQEVLTKDRVTIRVNITADMRVTDPVKAAAEVKDFDEVLHRALQLAFRKTIGQRTLDNLLADRVTLDAEAAQAVRDSMVQIGVEVGEIALKDVILPGEMREILNRVV